MKYKSWLISIMVGIVLGGNTLYDRIVPGY